MSGKWTPGPWHCHRNTSYWEFGSDERGQLGDVCASAFNGDGMEPDAEEVMEANARLISSSPQLFDALKDLVDETADMLTWGCEPDVIRNARAALAKAKGEGA
ncbi:hypothetical protein [Asaia sp. HN010]|uniref:hypothetical protein n=1 Tax=Asaia sp. HN010 TaxID=3081233 RepID=UPI003016F3B8